jgi:hypothetical protein
VQFSMSLSVRPELQPIPFLGCVTLQQPYASAIFDAPSPKDVENRRKPILRVPEGGGIVGIHAGETVYRPLRTPTPRATIARWNEWSQAAVAFDELWPGVSYDELPRGQILGLVYTELDTDAARELVRTSRWTMHDQAVHYPILHRFKLTEPIDAKGGLGCWDPIRARHQVDADDYALLLSAVDAFRFELPEVVRG